jgi:hypothetical protein
MDRFVKQQNIAHDINQLKAETDPATWEILETLLAEEKGQTSEQT